MDGDTDSDRTSVERELLEGQIRECFGRVVYSHKTHEKCADLLQTRLGRIKLWQLVLSGATTAGFISTVFGSGQVGAAIGTAISAVLLVLTAYAKEYDLGELSQKHRQAGVDLWIIRERYLSLLTDLRAGLHDTLELCSRRDELMRDLHKVYTGTPQTNYDAYSKAQEALKSMEDLTFSDAEIDAFLPKGLKRG